MDEATGAIPPDHRALLESRFGDLGRRRVTVPVSFGYSVYVVDETVIRIPTQAWLIDHMDHEVRLLGWLAPLLPFRIPAPCSGRHGDLPYMAYDMIPGHGFAALSKAMAAGAAERLAAIHAIDPGSQAFPFVDAEERFLAALSSALEKVEDDGAKAGIARTLERWRSTPRQDACLIHNDYHPRNLVWPCGAAEVCGVLDWTLAGIGDRHLDFRYFVGWACGFDEPLQATFRQAYRMAGGRALCEERLALASDLFVASEYLFGDRARAERLMAARRP